MAKLVLKPAPTFTKAVPVPVHGGDAVPVVFTFKHRTRDDFLAWLNEPSKEGRSDVEAIMDVASGWELAEPFDAENVGVLVQNYMGAGRVVIETYINELTGARRGN